jgi:hypothetical protein
MVPHPSAAGENQSYPKFWIVTGDPRYPGYKTSIVASEPLVERVVGVVHSMVSRIGTHMLLRVSSQDSMVKTWG